MREDLDYVCARALLGLLQEAQYISGVSRYEMNEALQRRVAE